MRPRHDDNGSRDTLAHSDRRHVLLRRWDILVQVGLVALGFALAGAAGAGPDAGGVLPWIGTGSLAAIVVTAAVRLARRRARLVAELRTLATRGALTGALNRAAFEEVLATEVARCRRGGDPISMLVFDIDHFKTVNDRHGHAAGDDALQRVCRLIADHVRASDVFARIGGEEFVLLLPDTWPEDAERLADGLRERVHSATREQSMPLTVSVGVAGTHAPSRTGDLLAAADRALYEAKRRGRNRVVRAPLLCAA